MARHTKVVLIDDLDGTPATHTHTITLDGRTVRLDVNDAHHDDLIGQMNVWLSAGSTVKRVGRTRGGGDEQAARAWARRAGVDVPARGRVPAAVMRRWRDAGEPRP